MRRFNTAGLCTPEYDYMVDISNKINEISMLIDRGCYFTINRARQYGKTTTLNALKRKLSDKYTCIGISFEGVGTTMFSSARSFCTRFLRLIGIPFDGQENEMLDFDDLSIFLTKVCTGEKIVLMIDEVDKAGSHEVFVHFLGMLRNKFNERKESKGAAFHSVILSGVYDVKNIKLKVLNAHNHNGQDENEKIYNSPWNIAINFNVDMSFNPDEIITLLYDYESEQNMKIDKTLLANEIYYYTSGYPFLVSRICQCVDEEFNKDWTIYGIQEVVRKILVEKNTLFDDIFKNIENNKKLYDFIYDILITGIEKNFVISNPIIDLGYMYGFFIKKNGKVAIANKIFELLMFEHFISKEERFDAQHLTGVLQYDVVKNKRFNMELCVQKFAEHYNELFNKTDIDFLERHGRLLFLSFLKPLINGQGFYHIESQLTDLRRMDIVVDYNRQQFVIELKRWRGEHYHEEAYAQLCGYLDSKSMGEGYLITFDFRKDKNKVQKATWVNVNGKRIFDVII